MDCYLATILVVQPGRRRKRRPLLLGQLQCLKRFRHEPTERHYRLLPLWLHRHLWLTIPIMRMEIRLFIRIITTTWHLRHRLLGITHMLTIIIMIHLVCLQLIRSIMDTPDQLPSSTSTNNSYKLRQRPRPLPSPLPTPTALATLLPHRQILTATMTPFHSCKDVSALCTETNGQTIITVCLW